MAAFVPAVLILSAPAGAGPRRPAIQAPLLTIDIGGCHFRPEIEAIIKRVHAQVPDRPPYRATVRARFAFGPLHGVGVAAEAQPDFSGEELYFREDRAALRRVLSGLGFHVDRNGDVAEAAKFVDGGIQMVSASVRAVDPRTVGRQFPGARSLLGCGSL